MGNAPDPHPEKAEHLGPQPKSHLDEAASVLSELKASCLLNNVQFGGYLVAVC